MISAAIRKEVEAAFKQEIEAAANTMVRQLANATPVYTGHAQHGWRAEGNRVVNDVDYIRELNDGSSKQAEAHFIERTILSNRGMNLRGVI